MEPYITTVSISFSIRFSIFGVLFIDMEVQGNGIGAQLLGQLHPAGDTDRISCSKRALDVLRV